MFTVDADGLSLAERRSLLDWVIRPALRTVPGVADVNALGGVVRAFEVVPDQIKMAASGVTVAQLKEAIDANNRNDGAGRLGRRRRSIAWCAAKEVSRAWTTLRAIVVTIKGRFAGSSGQTWPRSRSALSRAMVW
jgi:cobalt-zinc-cadmium resistance protein CzcA